ncbi:MAG TPA: glycosyltransferase family 1 protein [Rikenellaceae bacterium]|nr:glycosyltransferase family 1 protein [Rikenellaceae bacterium]
MTLRVLFDAHVIGTRETGNETYIINLLQALSNLPNVKCGAIILPGNALPSSLSNVEPIVLKTKNDWTRLIFALPDLYRSWNADVLHVNYVGPFMSKVPFVTSLHDVSYKRFPSFFSPRDRLLFSILSPLSLQSTKAIITISHHAKQEIAHFYPSFKNKTFVTHLAANSIFRKINKKREENPVLMKFAIPDSYILVVGNLQPRKNVLRIIRAFAAIQNQITETKLVIVGQAKWQSSEIEEEVRKQRIENRVIFTGYITEEELVWLYNDATVFVYPSLYEGFGLPILEAMACGTPVITSNTSSMPEVAGDSALLVNPYNEEEITDAIIRIVKNINFAKLMSEKGLQRSRMFSWAKTAEETLKVYEITLRSSNAKNRWS